MATLRTKNVALLIAGLVLATNAFAQGNSLKIIHDKTQTRLEETAARTRGALGLVALDLTSGERFAVNANNVFPQASAIKIAILMEVYKQAQAGKFKLTDLRRIEKKDK